MRTCRLYQSNQTVKRKEVTEVLREVCITARLSQELRCRAIGHHLEIRAGTQYNEDTAYLEQR